MVKSKPGGKLSRKWQFLSVSQSNIFFTVISARATKETEVFASSHKTLAIVEERAFTRPENNINGASLWENRSSGFPTRSDTNRAVQLQKMARSLKLRI